MMRYHKVNINLSGFNQVQRCLDTMILAANISYGKFFSLELVNIKRDSLLPGSSYYDESATRL